MVVQHDPRPDQHLAATQKRAQLVRRLALDVNLTVPAGMQSPGDIARIDPVGLHRHGARRRLQVPRVETDHRQAGGRQTVVHRRRQRPSLEPDALEPEPRLLQPRGDRLRLRSDPPFLHHLARLIDDADRRLLHRNIQTDIMLHGRPPSRCCLADRLIRSASAWRIIPPNRHRRGGCAKQPDCPISEPPTGG